MRIVLGIALGAAMASGQTEPPPNYASLCAGCHGPRAAGTDRGPGLANRRTLRNRSAAQIGELIRNGTPGGMPGFPLPAAQLSEMAGWVRSMNASAFDVQPEGAVGAGEQFFFGKGQCATCHMVRGRGATNGPDLSEVGKQLTVLELGQVLDDPASRGGMRSSAGCPPWAWCPAGHWGVVGVRLRDGSTLRGFARNRGRHGLQLQTLDGKFRTLHESEYSSVTQDSQPFMPALKASATERRDLIAYLSRLDGVRPGKLETPQAPVPASAVQAVHAPAAGEWPGYHGLPGANRHSALNQIHAGNVQRLRLSWSYELPYHGLEMTPLVSGGIMYVTGPNRVCALDARTGREFWCYSRPRNSGGRIAGDAAKGANRGAALLGDRIFFATDNAHLICLNRITGALMWEVVMPETPGAYGATAAPLVVGDLVISGIGGGDGPLLGFLAAYKATTGEQAWRFWTIPKPGEPAAETWKGKAIEVGGGATWLTGSYDPATDTLYWPTGNPYPDTDGTDRLGDNLYTNCVVALDPKTGKLKWHFQFTPHDLWDWDATEPLVLVDTRFRGRDRKLLLQANRNGFFYVLDRLTGEFLLGEPFVKRLTWASRIDSKGRPVLAEGAKPTPMGTKACPAVRGATNWYSTAFNPVSRLFYVMAVEDCSIYRQTGSWFVPYADPANPPEKYLRAIDIETGKIAWEVPQFGPPEANYSGVLSTAGGLVFYGETGGGFAAVEAKSGRTLWHFESNNPWKASPMTYTAGGRQHVAIASGSTVLSFSLPD